MTAPLAEGVRERVLRIAALWLFWLGPGVILFQLTRHNVDAGVFGFDFRGTVWDGGRAVLAGHSPYPSPSAVAAITNSYGNPFVYPPPILGLAVPLALVPSGVAAVIWSLTLFAGVALAMFLSGVRDWRCFGIALLTTPVMNGFVRGNATLLLVPLLALAWRCRDERWAGSCALGVAIALKWFLWPLLVWLVVTRRTRSAVTAAAVAAAAVLGSWAAIGFAGLREYPALIHALDKAFGFKSASVSLLAEAFGASAPVAHALQYATGIGVLALAVGAALAACEGADRRSFSAAVVAAVVLNPVSWSTNLALLFVPIALLRPRFSPLWAAASAALWCEAASWGNLVVQLFIASVVVATVIRPAGAYARAAFARISVDARVPAH